MFIEDYMYKIAIYHAAEAAAIPKSNTILCELEDLLDLIDEHTTYLFISKGKYSMGMYRSLATKEWIVAWATKQEVEKKIIRDRPGRLIPEIKAALCT
jgi:hypothetical protein